MKVLFLNSPLKFSLVPRKYPLLTDTLTLTLRKEMTNEIYTPNFTFSVGQKLQVTITNQESYFKILDKFEIEIKNGEETIYLGRLQILKEGTNTQTFEYSSQNERFNYK